jgi:hypothetical protein
VLEATGHIQELEVHRRSGGQPPVLCLDVVVQGMIDPTPPDVDPQADPTDAASVSAGPDADDLEAEDGEPDDDAPTNTDPYNTFTSNTDE